MATPSEKSPGLESLMQAVFGRTARIEADECTTCGGPADAFRNARSEREYTISGMCQDCQDSVFGKD